MTSDIDNTENPSQIKLNTLEMKQNELAELVGKRSLKSYLFKKAEWMKNGEKCTKFFLNYQRQNYSKKNISRLILKSGQMINSKEEIQNELEKYFGEIFSENLATDLQYPFPISCKEKLSNSQKISCEGPITEEELHEVVWSFQKGKTPGVDGIPVEVYQTFFDSLKKPMLSCFNHSYQVGHLSETQKEGIISLLLKQDASGQYKNPEMLKNWRPITLQCYDTKILAKCIAQRIKSVLPNIIHYDQSGFLKGRCVGNNIRQLLELIENYELYDKKGLIFIADLEKAFDKINLNFVFNCLDFFNFGESIIKWVKTLYNDTRCKIMNNGHISNPVSIIKGVKQGCPLSPYLFIIAMEILAIKVRSSEAIEGLKIGAIESKISMYADDTCFLISPKHSCLHNLLELLETFSTYSGLKLNYEKCKVLRIGSLKRTHFKIQTNLPIDWTDGPVNILGIQIPESLKDLQINYEAKLGKIEKIMQPWKRTFLTLYGKVALINSLIVPQFVYLFMSLPSPSKSFFKTYEHKIFEFIWNSKPEKIKRNFFYNNYEVGGFKLLNLEALCFALKASLVQKMYLNPNWYISVLLKQNHLIFSKGLFMYLQLERTHMSYLTDLIKDGSVFLKEALESWLCFQFKPPENRDEILQQIIWLNSNILVEGKPLLWESAIKGGMIFINDIVSEEGKLMDYNQIVEVYGDICSPYSYNQLVSALKKNWKQKINNVKTKLLVCRPGQRNNGWLNGNKINKKINKFYLYNDLLITYPYKTFKKWEDLLDQPIPWERVFRTIYQTSIDARSRLFQIKILYNFLPTNKMLKVWGLQESDKCRFCLAEVESSDHLFWYCHVVASFWGAVEQLLMDMNVNCHLSLYSVVLGFLEQSKWNETINLVILLAKKFIFKVKNAADLNMLAFRNYIEHNYKVEECIIQCDKEKLNCKNRWASLIQ